MTTLAILVGVGVAADAWLLAFVALRNRRTWLKVVFAALAVSLILTGTAYVGTTAGLLSRGWDAAALWGTVLAHPLVAIYVLSAIHGETLPRRRPAVFLLLAPVPFLAAFAPFGGWSMEQAYRANPLGTFLVLCLSIPLAEAIYTRMTSPLLGPEAFWLLAGVTALIVAGPIYAFELQAAGLPDPGGANVATPIALGAFALVASHADPFPAEFPRHGSAWSGETFLEPGAGIVFHETRPKYIQAVTRREAARGRAVLDLARGGVLGPTSRERLVVAGMRPTRHAAVRALGTASEFLARAPGGIVALTGLADIAALSGWPRTRELVVRLRRLCRESRGTLLLPTARLRLSEIEDLRRLRFASWTLPEPAEEVQAILSRVFGTGGTRLLKAFLRAHGLTRGDFTIHHVPALVSFLERAVDELAAGTGDPAAEEGLRSQVDALARDLDEYASLGPRELAERPWPSRARGEAPNGLLVTAADYWKGREADELSLAARRLVAREPLYERARAVFLDQLGDAGESVLRSQIERLGKRPEDITPADVTRLADRASVDLVALVNVVDLPAVRHRLHGQLEAIRRRLSALVGEDP